MTTDLPAILAAYEANAQRDERLRPKLGPSMRSIRPHDEFVALYFRAAVEWWRDEYRAAMERISNGDQNWRPCEAIEDAITGCNDLALCRAIAAWLDERKDAPHA